MSVLFIYPEQGFGQQIRVRAMQEMLRRETRSTIVERVYVPGPKSVMGQFKEKLSARLSEQNSDAFARFYLSRFDAFVAEHPVDMSQIELIIAENHEGCILGRQYRGDRPIPLLFDMHGLAGEEAVGQGERDVRVQALEQVEKELIGCADRLVVVSRLMANVVSERYSCPKDKIWVIPCGAHVQFSTAQYAMPLRVVYAGGHGYYERLPDFLKMPECLSRRVESESGRFEFFHIGVPLPVSERPGDSIDFLGVMDHSSALKKMSTMQVGIAPSTQDWTRKVASPVKVADYASCGLPIVCPDVGEWSQIIQNYDAGLVVNRSDPELFVDAILQLVDEGVWRRKSKNALLMAAECYEWNRILAPIKTLLG